MVELKIVDFSVKYMATIETFAKRVLNIENSPGVWLKREGNDISNTYSKF